MTNLPHIAANGQEHSTIPALVGYLDIEEWAKIASPWRLVYLVMEVQTRRVNGVRRHLEYWIVTLQQRDASGVIHYCRLPVLPVTAAMEKDLEDLAMGYLRLVVRWARSAHYDLIPGLFAVPTDLDLVDAACKFIDWDRYGNRFVRTDLPGGDVC